MALYSSQRVMGQLDHDQGAMMVSGNFGTSKGPMVEEGFIKKGNNKILTSFNNLLWRKVAKWCIILAAVHLEDA